MIFHPRSTPDPIQRARGRPFRAMQPNSDNPFLAPFDTPFGTPPFDRIANEHFRPAFDEGLVQAAAALREIADHPEPPSFENTLEALEHSSQLLDTVRSVFASLRSAHTNPVIQDVSREIAPRLARHRDDILMNEKLFERVRAVWDARESLDLDGEQRTLLDETYKSFVRGGAGLDATTKATLRAINEELSELSVRFGENVLAETNAFSLVIDDEANLAGLPEGVRQAAADEAAHRGLTGRWVFTLHKPSLIPFLQSSERRDLRQQLFEAYISQGDHGNEHDNKAVAGRVAALRARRARLLGYRNHAHFMLERSMAEAPENVEELLGRLWPAAIERARQEAEELQALIDAEGGDFRLAPWDWWYYSERLRQQRFTIDDEVLRPYFPLERVRQGAFDVARRLFGIRFERRPEISTYHEEVEVFEVFDADDSHLGLFYTDYFPRDTKRSGAWMNNLRHQEVVGGVDVRPLVANVANFSRPSGGRPALLTLEEVMTLFHEFGHALHGLLSRCRYRSLSGTAVPRDFVELPSQLMENWAKEPEVLRHYARHWQTDEPIPDALIERLQEADRFNQGFATTEYLAAAHLDLAWHTLEDDVEREANSFERETLERLGLLPEIVSRYRSTYFNHVFSLGYSAGYYSYVWAEVLDADAFEAFKQRGLFDPKLARDYRRQILERGGSDRPMELYRAFRGTEPAIEPLLARRGLA